MKKLIILMMLFAGIAYGQTDNERPLFIADNGQLYSANSSAVWGQVSNLTVEGFFEPINLAASGADFTVDLSTNNIYFIATNYNVFVDSDTNNIAFTNGTFTVLSDSGGKYELLGSFSFSSSAASAHTVQGHLFTNGVIHNQFGFDRSISAANQIGSSSALTQIQMSESDTFDFRATSSGQTPTLTFKHFTITVKKVDN